jgi:hypothetical protein
MELFELVPILKSLLHCCLQMQTGVATLIVGEEKQEIRLRLTEDTLYVEKQELAYTYSPYGHIDLSALTKVCCVRDLHCLPVLKKLAFN